MNVEAHATHCDRWKALAEAVILSPGSPIPAQQTCCWRLLCRMAGRGDRGEDDEQRQGPSVVHVPLRSLLGAAQRALVVGRGW